MNDKWKRVLLALLLAAAMMISSPAVTAMAEGPASTPPEGLDLTYPVKITLAPGPAEYINDLKYFGNVVYDYYRIAEAVEDFDNGLTYKFSLNLPALADASLAHPLLISSYEELAVLHASDWRDCAQTAGEYILTHLSDAAVTALKTHVTDPFAQTQLSSGLYLVIAYSSTLPADEYIKWQNDDPFTGVPLGTLVNSGEYVYTYSPELIALPSPASEIPAVASPSSADPLFTTAGGNWQYEVTGRLKPARELRMGDLLVEKTVKVYNDTEDDAENDPDLTLDPVSFVFRVQAIKYPSVVGNDGTVTTDDTAAPEFEYDDYVMLSFTSVGVKSHLFEKAFPVNSRVLVTEVYSGAGYAPTGTEAAPSQGSLDDDSFRIIAPDSTSPVPPLTAGFENACVNELIQGYGIMNEYSYENANWSTAKVDGSQG